MKKFTGSYANTEMNFAILNINTNKKIIDTDLYGAFCVVQNIIQRGEVSLPSKYIMDQMSIDRSTWENIIQDRLYLISRKL